jgi:hypothetical protein
MGASASRTVRVEGDSRVSLKSEDAVTISAVAHPKRFSASGGVADFRDKRWKGRVRTMNSVKIVEQFWERVWKARNPAAIDDFVTEDFVITTGGVDVVSRTKFKEWAAAFMAKIDDLQFEVIETFQNDDGSRVASRWRIAGKNNGILGTPADQQPISFTGTAVWAVREDGKLGHNWVERSSLELFQQPRNSRSAVGRL